MDSFLKHIFVRAGKHTTVHGVHPHTGTYVGEVEEIMCVVYVSVTEGA